MGTLKWTGNESFLEVPQVVDKPKDTVPFLIAIDTREQPPFLFKGLENRGLHAPDRGLFDSRVGVPGLPRT